VSQEFDIILSECLTELAHGKATVEGCLRKHWEMAGELRPLLMTAQTLRSVPKPTLSSGVRSRIEQQMLAAAAADPRLRLGKPEKEANLGGACSMVR
jgi:hypothetical protein